MKFGRFIVKIRIEVFLCYPGQRRNYVVRSQGVGQTEPGERRNESIDQEIEKIERRQTSDVG